MGMMVIRGIYEHHGVTSLNHGIGFDTAAIELLLPTYGAGARTEGQDLPQLGPESASDPHSRHRERLGRKRALLRRRGGHGGLCRARAPTCSSSAHDGSLRSNRVLCQLAGQYGVDLFIGSTLQMDADANSSTVTLGRLAGFGGAPNMGHDPRGRRHSEPAWLSLITADGPIVRGRKLVVQLVETFKKRRRAGAGRIARCGTGRARQRDAARAGHDLRRRCEPRRERGGHRLSLQGAGSRGAARGARGDRRRDRHRPPRRPRPHREPARARAWSPTPRTSACSAPRRAARCWPRAASRTWSPGPGGLYQPPARFRSW